MMKPLTSLLLNESTQSFKITAQFYDTSTGRTTDPVSKTVLLVPPRYRRNRDSKAHAEYEAAVKRAINELASEAGFPNQQPVTHSVKAL